SNSNGFFHDCFFDELCWAAGADPLDERIRLALTEPTRKVLEAVKEMSGWTGPKLGENRGRGVGYTFSHGVPAAEVIEVTATESGIKIDKVFVAVDVGRVYDPVNLEAQVMGGVVWGLGHAMNCELVYENYRPKVNNYHGYEGMRMYQTPEIEVRALENLKYVKGVGEPSVPPAAPALANAIFAATGKRIRELPLYKHIDFV
ncbi:MAG: molybdopterin cofactor-binding domain-containing protein, partial [Myxococcota bacterium]